ncbi:MAG TPA: 1-deoxy-D-xylulose-5-phosphate synthase, partial [Actinomycetota bacterium]
MLESIRQPSDLRHLSGDQLRELAAEIRDFLVRAVSARGGHLGPNLGVVELTIALHRAFDSPTDRIVWDTGHQAYVHKLLTGRQADFANLRTFGGLSGYPSRSESPHDVIENSHASTALGYALGLAEARRAGRGEGRVVAVVGDGSLTGGVALEALNLIGHRKPDLLVILNDNGRSYAPTVGGLAGHLAPFRLHPGYETLKKGVEETLGRVPLVGDGMVEAAKRVKEGAKALVAPRVVFEDLGWQYAGPVDGHDLGALEKAIDHAMRVPGPVMLHVITQKGRGYPPAEEHEEDKLHSPSGAFDPETGRPLPKGGDDEVQFTEVFGQALLDEARRHPELVAISAAMLGPTKLTVMQKELPDRVFDVGIAEQVGVTMAAGMALQGLRPVCAIYSTFLQRAFDQVIMDVALHRLPVIFVLDRSGITGPDGSSHHGVY